MALFLIVSAGDWDYDKKYVELDLVSKNNEAHNETSSRHMNHLRRLHHSALTLP